MLIFPDGAVHIQCSLTSIEWCVFSYWIILAALYNTKSRFLMLRVHVYLLLYKNYKQASNYKYVYVCISDKSYVGSYIHVFLLPSKKKKKK